jgi:Uma2 family endonuclease
VGASIADFRESIAHLSPGASVIIHQIGWDEYERLVDDLRERPGFRVSYDDGRLEIMTALSEHEKYARFIGYLVVAMADDLGLTVEDFGSTTWKSRRLAKAAEPECVFFCRERRSHCRKSRSGHRRRSGT